MTAHLEVIRQSDLINQLVLDRHTLEELGRVEVLWMYPPTHRVLGFISKSGFLGAKKAAFKLSQIHALGSNGILTRDQPEATTADRVQQLESPMGLEVWSDDGNKIGKLVDCLFSLKTGQITQYLFVSNGWSGITGEVYQLPPQQIVSFGKKRVLVSEKAAAFAVYQAGLTQKLSKVSEFFKEESRSIAQQAEAVTEQAKGRWQSLAEQAKERVQEISQQAKEKAQLLNEQLIEETQTLLERAKEKSQTLVEQVKERTQSLDNFEDAESPTEPCAAIDEIEDIEALFADLPREPIAPLPTGAVQEAQPSSPAAIDDEDDEPWI